MIRYIYRDQLSDSVDLADSMFKHRTAQFKDRLDWEVSVDQRGWELDQYDAMNPLYIVWENPNGTHGGSVRLMPSTGRIMTNEHFSDIVGGVKISSPLIWECTRFCIAPNGSPSVAANLLIAGVEFGLRFGLEQALGVIYAKTIPIYRRIGSEPDIIGRRGDGPEAICVGLWSVSEDTQSSIARKTGVSIGRVKESFESSFGGKIGSRMKFAA